MQTSPVLACRRSLPRLNVRGSVGFPIPGTSLRLVDPETLQEVPRGQQGLVRGLAGFLQMCRWHGSTQWGCCSLPAGSTIFNSTLLPGQLAGVYVVVVLQACQDHILCVFQLAGRASFRSWSSALSPCTLAAD